MLAKITLLFALVLATTVIGCRSRTITSSTSLPEANSPTETLSTATAPRHYQLLSTRDVARRIEQGVLGGHGKNYRADDGTEAQMLQLFFLGAGQAAAQLQADVSQALASGYTKIADKPWQDARHGQVGRVVLVRNEKAEVAFLAHEKLYVSVISSPGYASEVMEIYLDSPAFSQSLPLRPVAPQMTEEDADLHDSEPDERMCYQCNGTGQIGPFGNPYGDYGYKPAETCPNCHGTGRVRQ